MKALLATLLLCALAACGQTGDLYLPDASPAPDDRAAQKDRDGPF